MSKLIIKFVHATIYGCNITKVGVKHQSINMFSLFSATHVLLQETDHVTIMHFCCSLYTNTNFSEILSDVIIIIVTASS
jgi:hypothetical protein